MAFYLAVDVGGTKTDYVLADDTRELARVRTGTIKRLRVDAATAAVNLEEGLTQLSALTGVSMSAITRTCIGTAGESVPVVRDWLRESVAARVAGELILLGDVEIALDAAFHGGPGVLVMAGTGSNVAGRMADGSLTTAGGWGPALSDQGSGHRIGLEALRAAFLALDEAREEAEAEAEAEAEQSSTLLLDAVREFWQLPSLEHLVELANSHPAPDFSGLTEVILRCANQGDSISAAVLKKEGEDLAWLVRLVIRRLQSASAASSASGARAPSERRALPRIAFTGSILGKVQPVRDALIASVRWEFPGIQTLDGVVDPITGAVWRARTHTRS